MLDRAETSHPTTASPSPPQISGGAWPTGLLVAGIVGGSGVLLFDVAPSAYLQLLAAAVAVGSWWVLVGTRARERLRRPVVIGVGAALLLVAVAMPPRQSHDLWIYAMYGRTVTAHGSSPYAHPPRDFPGDPALRRVDAHWRATTAPYGPVFVGTAALVVAATGTDELTTRLAFQGLAALAVVLALGLLVRRGVSAQGLALVALNPVIIVEVVNGGHNDALIGVLVLAAALLASDDRVLAAGAALAIAALVKIVLAIALVAFVAWVWRRHGARRAVATGALGGTLVGAGYVFAAGPSAFASLEKASEQMTRTSVWQLVRPGQIGHFLAIGARASDSSREVVTNFAPFAVVLLVVALSFLTARAATPVPTLVAAAVAYLLLAAYVLPWYVAWVVPVLALDRRSLVATVAIVQCGLLFLAWQYRGPAPPSPRDGRVLLWWSSTLLVSVLAVVALVAITWRVVDGVVRSRRAPQTHADHRASLV